MGTCIFVGVATFYTTSCEFLEKGKPFSWILFKIAFLHGGKSRKNLAIFLDKSYNCNGLL